MFQEPPPCRDIDFCKALRNLNICSQLNCGLYIFTTSARTAKFMAYGYHRPSLIQMKQEDKFNFNKTMLILFSALLLRGVAANDQGREAFQFT